MLAACCRLQQLDHADLAAFQLSALWSGYVTVAQVAADVLELARQLAYFVAGVFWGLLTN